MEIKEYIEEKKKSIDSALENLLFPLKEYSALYPALSYSLLSGGKRIRPVIALATYEANKEDSRPIIPFACAIEIVHTYSLIHDDLPIMDDSNMRRGRPTLHRVYGSDMALLAGDALLSLAFEIVSSTSHEKVFTAEKLLAVVREFGKATGIRGLVGGQVMDMVTMNEENVEESMVIYIDSRKTGELMKLAIRTGAILGDAENSELIALSEFAENFGISYQIVDDILDEVATVEVTGKDTGKDRKNRKATFIALYGVDRAKEIAKDFVNKSKDYLKPFGEKYKVLMDIAELSLQRMK